MSARPSKAVEQKAGDALTRAPEFALIESVLGKAGMDGAGPSESGI